MTVEDILATLIAFPSVVGTPKAGLFRQAGIDAIICGPGDISRAHRPGEYTKIGELAACQKLIENFATRLAA
jgi:acetylornithine deacetylase